MPLKADSKRQETGFLDPEQATNSKVSNSYSNIGEVTVVLPEASKKRRSRVRRNYTFDPDFAEALDTFAQERNIPVSQFIEHTLSQIINFKR